VKVFVATSRTQGEQDDDYCCTLDGELVHLPVLECASPDGCGCIRGFAGIASHRATTTAEVATRDLTDDGVLSAVTDSLISGGWVPDAQHDAALHREAELLAHEVTADLLELATRLPVGSVLGRRGTKLLVRRFGAVEAR
jgi:hypothetical protein